MFKNFLRKLASGSREKTEFRAVHVLNTSVFRAPGGLERYVLESSRFAENELGIGTLHLSPAAGEPQTLELSDRLQASRALSGEEFKKLLSDGAYRVDSFHLHHSLNWNEEDFFEISEFLIERTTRSVLYVHDCHFASEAKKGNSSRFRQLFERFARIVAPSETARDFFAKAFPSLGEKIEILPHLDSSFEKVESQPDAERTCIIFSGACGTNKGIERYTELINTFGDKFRWATVGIENRFADNPHVTHKHFNFHEGENIVEILRALRPAVAYLASVVPETFSYSVHEMLVAGIPVLCTPESGNIAATVRKESCGLVFADFAELKKRLDKEGENILKPLESSSKLYRVTLNKAALRSLYTN